MGTVDIGTDDAKYTKQLHQDILRAAKDMTEAQKAFGSFVRELKVKLRVPCDTAVTRWLMREDATAFFEVDATVPQDFTKPVVQ